MIKGKEIQITPTHQGFPDCYTGDITIAKHDES